jgi:hypothetical protein
MDDLVPDIDRCPVRRERAVDDFDGADDAGAEAPRLGENQSHPLPFVHSTIGYPKGRRAATPAAVMLS